MPRDENLTGDELLINTERNRESTEGIHEIYKDVPNRFKRESRKTTLLNSSRKYDPLAETHAAIEGFGSLTRKDSKPSILPKIPPRYVYPQRGRAETMLNLEPSTRTVNVLGNGNVAIVQRSSRQMS